MRLVIRRRVHAVDAALQVAARDGAQRVADVDGDGRVLRLDPLPLALRVEDLQRRDGLPEEEGDGSEVGVPWCEERADALVLLGRARLVVHVAQVVLALFVVDVVADELLLVGELEHDGEEAEELVYHELVAFLRG